MKKLLFAGDSLLLPRPDKSIIEEDTWVSRVMVEFAGVFIPYFQGIGGASTKTLLIKRKYAYLGGYEPDILILQVGIVDCAPRAFTELEMKIFQTLRLGTYAKKIARRYHPQMSMKRKLVTVKPKLFKNNLLELRKSFENSTIVVVPIAPANDDYKRYSPDIPMNIQLYNEILCEVFERHFLAKAYAKANIEKLFLSDNHHLSEYGHHHLAGVLIEYLRDLVK